MNENIFYVYVYLRKCASKNGPVGSPYYVGKGKLKRAYDEHDGLQYIPDDKSRIIIVKDNLLEDEAFNLERTLIWWFGRIDLTTGCLRNLTDGGEGASGYVFPKPYIRTDFAKQNLVDRYNESLESIIPIESKPPSIRSKNIRKHNGNGISNELVREIREAYNAGSLETMLQKKDYAFGEKYFHGFDQ